MRLALFAPVAVLLLSGCVAVIDGEGDARPQIVPAAAPSPEFRASPAAIEAHVRFLADDLLEGREAGTRGYDLAASYVANRFRELGLKPASDAGTYLQSVPLVWARNAAQGALSLVDDRGRATPLA